jgi:chemotaxis protein methyltransferase CheR
MMPSEDPRAVERFRGVVGKRLGLQLENDRLEALALVLRRRLDVTGLPTAEYLGMLEASAVPEEVSALAEELTIPETFFFRNPGHYRALAEVALPNRMAEQAGRRLNILSAGCASGEEAYSLAITARPAVEAGWQVSILGVDLNPAVLAKAARGRYTSWALRDVSSAVRMQWFRSEGAEFVLAEDVRAAVRFERWNLALENAALWRPEFFDIVFFRNVMMYFTPQIRAAAVARVSQSLKSGGYLFLGHAESLRDMPDDFTLQHTHDTFYYRRKPRHSISPRRSSKAAARDVLPAPPVAGGAYPAVIAPAIGLPATRTANLPARTDHRAVPWDLSGALACLREERFADALTLIEGAPADMLQDPDVLLVRAVVLTLSGRFADATLACEQLLGMDAANTGANYLLALCEEDAGNLASAAGRHRMVVHQDPAFAMPHLHLGLLARRAGDREAAASALGRALVLLEHESSERLLLFGGGFSRDALTALCQRELIVCGGRR